jgi:hypothetical protein
VRQRSADARNLIGCNAYADAGAANEDGAVIGAVENGGSHAVGEVGVECICASVCARDLRNLETILEVIGEYLGQTFTSAVACYCYFHNIAP